MPPEGKGRCGIQSNRPSLPIFDPGYRVCGIGSPEILLAVGPDHPTECRTPGFWFFYARKASQRPPRTCPDSGAAVPAEDCGGFAPNQQVVLKSPQISSANALLRVPVYLLKRCARGLRESVPKDIRPPCAPRSPGALSLSQWLCQHGMLKR